MYAHVQDDQIVLSCDTNGEWQVPTASCPSPTECPVSELPSFPNAIDDHSDHNTVNESVVWYYCERNNEVKRPVECILNAENQPKWMKQGTWSDTFCDDPVCSDPPAFPDADVCDGDNDRREGYQLTYKCEFPHGSDEM